MPNQSPECDYALRLGGSTQRLYNFSIFSHLISALYKRAFIRSSRCPAEHLEQRAYKTPRQKRPTPPNTQKQKQPPGFYSLRLRQYINLLAFKYPPEAALPQTSVAKGNRERRHPTVSWETIYIF